jgi:AraC family transcriptional regulator
MCHDSHAELQEGRETSPEEVNADAPVARPPRRGTPRQQAVAHTAGVTTFDRESALNTTQNAEVPSGGADRASQPERRRTQLRASRSAGVHASMLEQHSRDLLVVTAQLIEAACRAKDGDSDGTRAHIARAVALLDGYSGPRIAGQPSDRSPGQVPRGGFAAWQSRRLAAHVDANLTGRIVIKHLAASLQMSVGHFCRAFKCTFGMPARIWIRHRRIELAQGLMLTTDASLSEIALSCGMSDQSHFTRSFRRIVGETPSSWRQTRHGAIEERVTEIAYPPPGGTLR